MSTDLASAATMTAVHQSTYGGPEVLRVGPMPRPALRPDGVLVRVLGASTNKADWHLTTGTPYLVRLAGFGFSAPKAPIVGQAMAGRVEAVSPEARGFAVGDEVFGEINRGAFAEFVCVRPDEIALKPKNLDFAEAAALPLAGTTALQGVRDAAKLTKGQSILINGAAGGVGTFAVQMAHAMGAVVTGVCSARNVALVRSLGADDVIAYDGEDYTRSDRRWDVLFDLIGNHSLADNRRVLNEGGRYVSGAGGAEHEWIGPMGGVLWGMISNLASKKPFVPLVAKANQADLVAVREMVEAGTVRPVIDRRYTLGEVPEAMRYLGEGHTRGKSVITV